MTVVDFSKRSNDRFGFSVIPLPAKHVLSPYPQAILTLFPVHVRFPPQLRNTYSRLILSLLARHMQTVGRFARYLTFLYYLCWCGVVHS